MPGTIYVQKDFSATAKSMMMNNFQAFRVPVKSPQIYELTEHAKSETALSVEKRYVDDWIILANMREH